MIKVVSEEIDAYIEEHSSREPALLADLNRRTHLDFLMPQMLSGRVQGSFLRMISHMIRPRRVLEIGTYTGYSAICLADGMTEDGLLFTIDVNEELRETVESYIRKSGLDGRIRFLCGDAVDIIPGMDEVFDLVFIDADKVNYTRYFDLVVGKVRKGGFILADNVLWSGKVLDDVKDEDTFALDSFNKKVSSDNRVECVIVSIRDGIMIARKY